MAISIEDIKQAKAKANIGGKPVKLGVGAGVRLNITKSSAVFQYRYKIKVDDKTKERTLTLDKLIARNDVTLAKAITDVIEKAENAKNLIKQGLDPQIEKQITKINNSEKQLLTLKLYFEAWIKKVSVLAQWSEKHYKDMNAKFKLHISPPIGALPLDRITRQHISELLTKLEDRPATHKKCRILINMIFEDAVTASKIPSNPVPKTLSKAVKKYKATSRPAVTNITRIHNIIAGINRSRIIPEVRTASLLQAHTGLRSQSVISAQWQEFDLTNKLWAIPRIQGRMKVTNKERGEYFNVPLSDEVVKMLKDWRNTLKWQDSKYLFPSNSKTGYLTVESLTNVFSKRLKITDHCAHGWRSSFSTIAKDALAEDNRALFRTDVVDTCLDHSTGSEVTRAYQRGDFLELRRHLMNWWSKQLNASSVVSIVSQEAV
ncbi:MAG: tyrosine-type recombinase/integrase [Colwellia sp.]|nr:tyrosine-type recombinase/integrase [Colwellia sp.]